MPRDFERLFDGVFDGRFVRAGEVLVLVLRSILCKVSDVLLRIKVRSPP